MEREVCRISDFHFQYLNWPIYPFYNLLKIMYNRDTRLFYKYSKVKENYRNGKENVQDARI